MPGAEGRESTHCGSFYVVEFIFMELKEAAASSIRMDSVAPEILHLMSLMYTLHYQIGVQTLGDA